jgi:hypothetical protein
MMIVGNDVFDIEELEPELRAAVLDGCSLVVDEAFNSLESLAEGGSFADTFMANWLPRKYLPRYNIQFARSFAVCLISVAGKLTDRHPHVLASVAEELALAAILDEAGSVLDLDGRKVDMRAEAEAAFQDTDFELLFDPRWDGLEDDDAVSHLAMANVRFEGWFRPFRDEIPVHPYVAEP